MGQLYNELLVRPIINGLVGIYHVLLVLGIPYPLGFSIILLTVAVRLVIYPLTVSQIRTSKKMQQIAPHLSHVKEKHKGDTKKVQEETMKIYKEHGVNPAAGCLPALLQLPLFITLYSVLQKIVGLSASDTVSFINKSVYLDIMRLAHAPDHFFFGLPLGKNPSQLLEAVPLILLVPILTGLFQFVQSKMMATNTSSLIPLSAKGKDDKKSTQEDFASAMQTQSLYIFPVMIGFFSYTFPIGLSLYWNTFTFFGILQQYHVAGLGGLTVWVDKLKLLKTKK